MSKKVDFNKISQQKVKWMLAPYQIAVAQDFEKIRQTLEGTSKSDYLKHFASFKINAPANQVWEAYKHITPLDSWAGKFFEFALLYNPNSPSVYYPTDKAFPSIAVGQAIFIQLNLAKGLVKVPVGQKIIRVDDAAMEIESSYLECSASRGAQVIRIKADGPTSSIIEHETWYKSGQWFRDKVLYPPLHLMVIRRLHRNVARFILKKG